ncbi:CGLD27 family protein [Parathermosynechococcus lividus]
MLEAVSSHFATVSQTLCPVPADQRPINEYRDLQGSWFFGWSMWPLPRFQRRLALLWGMAGVVSGPLAIASMTSQAAPAKVAVAGVLGATLLVLLVVVRLILGWLYVGDRLQRPTVIYEETGWYDGQEWPKPEAELAQDRLIYTYELRPVLQRLRVTLIILLLFSVSLIGLWGWL